MTIRELLELARGLRVFLVVKDLANCIRIQAFMGDMIGSDYFKHCSYRFYIISITRLIQILYVFRCYQERILSRYLIRSDTRIRVLDMKEV
jgi:hypothetical protein